MNQILLEEQGWRYLSEKSYDIALGIFNKIYAIDNENIAAIQGRIACYRKKGDYNKALLLLENALIKYFTEPGILSEKAWIHLEQKEYEEAINAFKELLRIKKDDLGIFLWQLYLLRRQRHYSQSQTLIKEANEIFPNNASILIEKGWVAFYEFQYEDSIKIFDQILVFEPLNELAFQGKIACLRMKTQYIEAIELTNKAISKFEKSPGLYSERGWINFESGNFDAAEKDFRKVITLVNNDPYPYVNLAWSLIKQGTHLNLVEAIEHCKEALVIEPDLSEAFSCLGNIAFKKEEIRMAESYFIRSIKSDRLRGSYADLGALYIQMEKYEEAYTILSKGLENNPDDVYAHLEMGYLYLNTDRIKEAIREFRIITVLNPNNPESFKALGIALTENSKFIEAEKVLRSAIKSFNKQKNYGLHVALSQLLIASGDQTNDLSFYEEALKEIYVAMHINPNDASCLFYVGLINFKLGDYKNSLVSFRKCLKQDGKYLEAELNEKKIKGMLQKQKALIRSSRSSSFFLTTIFLLQLIFVWILYFKTTKMTSTMIGILVPILSGLLIISILLPWLSRFKMSGIEAELSDAKPKESLASGPKGDIVLYNSSRKPF
jgi:tetratricopeptide (TPR) repeat protein